MPNRRSDGQPKPASAGRVKAESRASGSAPALALMRPTDGGIIPAARSPLKSNKVADGLLTGASKPQKGQEFTGQIVRYLNRTYHLLLTPKTVIS